MYIYVYVHIERFYVHSAVVSTSSPAVRKYFFGLSNITTPSKFKTLKCNPNLLCHIVISWPVSPLSRFER